MEQQKMDTTTTNMKTMMNDDEDDDNEHGEAEQYANDGYHDGEDEDQILYSVIVEVICIQISEGQLDLIYE